MAMDLPDEVVERVLSYVNHQAAKGPQDLRGLIERTAAEFDSRLDGMSEEQASFKPAADEWSVIDVLSHISSVTAATGRLAAELARGESVTSTDENPGAAGSLAAMRERMADAWAVVSRSVDGLSADPDVSAEYAHPAFGSMNCVQWLVFARVHALDHAQQIDKIKADPRYPGA